MTSDISFGRAFRSLTGNDPFPWQEELFDRLSGGEPPDACDIPTGLGKTSIIPIWLIALAERGPVVPQRLVYVVNRRTVVDQATAEAEAIRDRLIGPGHGDAGPELTSECRRLREALTAMAADPAPGPLAISTLRGQFADNREWSADPSRAAIIVGTVDMIGSRLLFSGYGAGFRTKPLHAGFLGQDALIVHDEAHLEPAFQALIEAIRDEQEREPAPLGEARRLKVMALTATPRTGSALRLSAKDREHPVVRKRIDARKTLVFHESEDESKLADLMADRALGYRESGRAVLVFARKLETVEKVAAKLAKEREVRFGMLTGTLRGKEREALVRGEVFSRFLPGPRIRGETVYLICTSAGEVGVNISADHLVCDLSTLESMAQRLGRVNRFGDRDDTRVDVCHPARFDPKDESGPRREKTLALLRRLDGDASPAALGRLLGDLAPKEREAAFSPEPRIPPTTDILLDAWALTSVRGRVPGRPPVEPYLHGLSDWDPPETRVAWREEVGILLDELPGRYRRADLLADYPLKPHELLRDRSDRVFKHLSAIAGRHGDAPAWLVHDDGTVEFVTLKELADKEGKGRIDGRTVLLPPSVGGMTDGLLDGATVAGEVSNDVADEWTGGGDRPGRRRTWDEDARPEGMRLVRRVDTRPPPGDEDEDDGENEAAGPDGSGEGPVEPAPRDRWRDRADRGKRWRHWYVLPGAAEDVGSRTSPEPVSWDAHTRDVVKNVGRIVAGLSIPEDLATCLILAARCHDLGKRRVVWQRSIGNPDPSTWLAKSGGHRAPAELTAYRHEFGSLLDAEAELKDANLDEDARDLVLHLIAAHHGRGRPHFTPEESFDHQWPHPDASRVAAEVPRRFARLQRRYGRWGLAYLESLLRAADYAASAKPSLSEDP